MSAVKALIFGIDDLFPKLKPYYDREVEKGNLEIIGYAEIESKNIKFLKNLQGESLKSISFDKLIISSRNNFFPRFKIATQVFHNVHGSITLDNVIDGRVFQIMNFDLLQFCAQGKIQVKIPDENIHGDIVNFSGSAHLMYPRIYSTVVYNFWKFKSKNRINPI